MGIVNQVAQRLAARGAELSIHVTRGPGHAAELAEQVASTSEVVLVVGGDGTVSDVVRGLIDRSTPMVVLGTGTENLVAHELDMPRDAESVAQTLLFGRRASFDVGTVNGRHFLAVVGVGFDAECVRRFVRIRRGHVTHASYFWPIWRTFWAHRFPMLRVSLDGKPMFEGRGLAFVGGIARYGAGLRILREARLDDGLLDVCVFPTASKTRLLRHAAIVAAGRHLRHGGTIHGRSRRVTIESLDRVWTEIDGDSGMPLPIECSILAGAASYLRRPAPRGNAEG
jgi:diacylglycerol kinase family enzyme